jgi:hypothetical protein
MFQSRYLSDPLLAWGLPLVPEKRIRLLVGKLMDPLRVRDMENHITDITQTFNSQ